MMYAHDVRENTERNTFSFRKLSAIFSDCRIQETVTIEIVNKTYEIIEKFRSRTGTQRVAIGIWRRGAVQGVSTYLDSTVRVVVPPGREVDLNLMLIGGGAVNQTQNMQIRLAYKRSCASRRESLCRRPQG